LLVIEREPRLLAILHRQFPELTILRADAAELDQVLVEHGIDTVNSIVSSLPLLSMPRLVRSRIESCMATVIHSGGRIIQFTYGSASPIQRERWEHYHLYGMRKKTVLTNVPPAHVWVFHRERRDRKTRPSSFPRS
jgi:phosphatidylethanolamine/phosphatidyl-N-methylethanolamine N-methyltransferase